jgi:TPR repeat protein
LAQAADPSLAETVRRAKAGDSGAQYVAGMMYLFGQGTKADVPEAIRWLEMSAKAGMPQALVAMASLSDIGYGVPLDFARATQLRQQAAKIGNPTARAQLDADQRLPGARDFRRADALTDFKQYSAALPYARKSAEAGSPDGQELLGRALLFGYGTAKNPAEAIQWFLMSDAGGAAAGSRAMGYVYEFGVGVPVDRKKALVYYDRAAARGSQIAKKVAANLRSPDYDRPPPRNTGGGGITFCTGGMVWDSGFGYCRPSAASDPPNTPTNSGP